MFAFYNSDAFTITLEILFLLFIAYDTKRYVETKKREYLFNIILTIGFFFWALVPFYNKYFTWQEPQKEVLLERCVVEHNSSYCECMDDAIFKEYDFNDYQILDHKNDADYLEFYEEADTECRGESSWYSNIF